MAILGFSSTSKPASEYLQPGHLGAAAALKGQTAPGSIASTHLTPSKVQPRPWHGGTPLLAETRRDTISLSSPSRPSSIQPRARKMLLNRNQMPWRCASRAGVDTLMIRRHHHLNLLAPLLQHQTENSHGGIANEATGKDTPVRKSSDRLNPSKSFYTDSCLDEHPVESEELGLPSSGGSSAQSKRTKSTLLIIDERGKGRRPKMRSRKETFGLAERHPGAFAAIELYPLLLWPIRAAN
ncbi:hypothetical protein V8C44DRAFT_348119 [Trichoderma aethiopicum]